MNVMPAAIPTATEGFARQSIEGVRSAASSLIWTGARRRRDRSSRPRRVAPGPDENREPRGEKGAKRDRAFRAKATNPAYVAPCDAAGGTRRGSSSSVAGFSGPSRSAVEASTTHVAGSVRRVPRSTSMHSRTAPNAGRCRL